jgi:hypothetical protein
MYQDEDDIDIEELWMKWYDMASNNNF